jgi:morphogenetic protein associated with SpoVID
MSWQCKSPYGPGMMDVWVFRNHLLGYVCRGCFRMQQMARGGGMPSMESMMSGGGFPGMGGMPGMGAMPGLGGMPNTGGMPGMGGGGMPNMGGGGMPNMGGMDMEAMMKMAQSMGLGGAPPGSARR